MTVLASKTGLTGAGATEGTAKAVLDSMHDVITESIGSNGETNTIARDVVTERTAGAGVTVDGVIHKDGGVTAPGTILGGKSVVNFTDVGHVLSSAGYAYHTSASGPMVLNRVGGDGIIVGLYQDGTMEGNISVTGTTVTYGSFCGGHWAQLADGRQPDILPGTVMDTIDAMCAWPGEGNDQLARVHVSDTPGSRSVYGVFQSWAPSEVREEVRDPETGEVVDVRVIGHENPTGDMLIASLGAYLIRVGAGVTVQRGDLLESAGDGTARVQADDLMRASTIAKVTAAVVVRTYDDGSYLVPCTLHCG